MNVIRRKLGVEIDLVLFIGYVGFLLFLLIRGAKPTQVLSFHVASVLFYYMYKYRLDFLFILIAPITAVAILADTFRLKNFLKKFKQNVHAETVVVLEYSDWRKLDAWVRPKFFTSELKKLVRWLRAEGKDFSFFPKAGLNDVESIMADRLVKEVCFYGHGSSHVFELSVENPLYYCEFNHSKYAKDFVHQMHCGTPDGKSLVDYIVPKNNRDKCFLVRKSITSIDIGKALDQKIVNAKK